MALAGLFLEVRFSEMAMKTICCTDKAGTSRTFAYTWSHDARSNEYRFKVETIPAQSDGAAFEMTVSPVDQSTVRVVMAAHHRHHAYMAKGIPEALLPIIKRDLQVSVESSPSLGHGNVYRTQDATKYWNRLVEAGGAVYDGTRGVYLVT